MVHQADVDNSVIFPQIFKILSLAHLLHYLVKYKFSKIAQPEAQQWQTKGA